MEILVINLDEDDDRLANIQKQIKNFTRMPAVKGADLTAEELNNLTTTFCRYFCTGSMIGCFLSHQKCWQYIIDEDLPHALVLEDDVELSDKFFSHSETILQTAPRDWDVILLGCMLCEEHNDLISKMIMSIQYTAFQPFLYKEDEDVNDYLYKPKIWGGTHCMLISNQGARKLLSQLNKASYHVDIVMNQIRLNLYTSRKTLAHQNSIKGKVKSHNTVDVGELDFFIDHNKMTFGTILTMPILQIHKLKITYLLLLKFSVCLLILLLLYRYRKKIKI